MSLPPEEFESLRELLAWKRHEQPPPGYFQLLAARIKERIEREQMAETVPWWAEWLSRWGARPVFACAYASIICGLLLAGFEVSQTFENESAPALTEFAPWAAAMPAPFGVTATAELQTRHQILPVEAASALKAEAPNFFASSVHPRFRAVEFRFGN